MHECGHRAGVSNVTGIFSVGFSLRYSSSYGIVTMWNVSLKGFSHYTGTWRNEFLSDKILSLGFLSYVTVRNKQSEN